MRLLLATTIAACSLVLTACDTGSSGDLESVKVSKSATPKVTVAKGFATTKTQVRVLKNGTGDALSAGDSAKVNLVGINGRTGKEFENSFASHQPMALSLSKDATIAGFVKGLTGRKVGSRLLVAVAPKDGLRQANPDLGIKKNDTMVYLFDVVAKIPTEAAGKSKDLPSDLPMLVLDSKQQPSKFKKTSTTAPAPVEASSHVVIKGNGPAIKLGQTLNINYLGQIYPSGKVFDSSWERHSPDSFVLAKGQRIECWTDGLVGQKVGSRVVLVCPADVAYGDKGSGASIKGGDTLIFSIDLLDAS